MTDQRRGIMRGGIGASAWHYRITGWQARPGIFAHPPEPRMIGSIETGRQLCAGIFHFDGQRVEALQSSIWQIEPPVIGFDMTRHGFTWLDDLAALGNSEAEELARNWVHSWLLRPGPLAVAWSPEIAARRLMRMINHAQMLERGWGPKPLRLFRKALTRHTLYLTKTWPGSDEGLPRFETLCGMIYAGLSLQKMEPAVRPGIQALEQYCADHIDENGSVESRNPSELLALFTHLVFADLALTEAGLMAQTQHRKAIERIAPTLRALRHADGGLARFHGGDRSADGKLDWALASAGVRSRRPEGLSMGYARLSRGRTTAIMDAAPPFMGPNARQAHASTLAFELTSGRRPLIVNCGSGAAFGEEWQRASRATPSHSTLGIEGFSSSRLGGSRTDADFLVEGPTVVEVDEERHRGPASIVAGHNGYETSHGLIHVRRLDLGEDGRALMGEDVLTAVTETDIRRFDRLLEGSRDDPQGPGIPFSIRFHLHPDVTASIDLGGTAASLMLKSGELWIFRHASNARLSLDPSVFLDQTRSAPVPCLQIVLHARAQDHATAITWSLAKAQASGPAIRDISRDEPAQLTDMS